MGSTFGSLFQVSTWGESHGGGIGVVVDGCPPRLPLTDEHLQADLDRRRPGQSSITTQRSETDRGEILSGVFEGVTTGSPIAVLVRNSDARPGAYEHLRDVYRPSHADFTYDAKYGVRDWRGGGRSSARETIGRVAAGAVARQLLRHVADIEVLAWVSQIHTIASDVDSVSVTLAQVEQDPTRCPDPDAAASMSFAIDAA
ncbi:MAG TPA: chorismate synthase, partial [Acidimicrobiales bacterium]|nr:chorismate synthase [Acidimicrobiales bacterium]